MVKFIKGKYYGARQLLPENLASARQNLKSQLEMLKLNARGFGQEQSARVERPGNKNAAANVS